VILTRQQVRTVLARMHLRGRQELRKKIAQNLFKTGTSISPVILTLKQACKTLVVMHLRGRQELRKEIARSLREASQIQNSLLPNL
jgi:hypothetical protein